MAVKTILKNKGVPVMLNGESHYLRFTMQSLAWLAEKHGTVRGALEEFAKIDSLASGEITADALHALADLLCASLMHEGDSVTAEYVETQFDVSEILAVLPDLVRAFKSGMGVEEKKRGGDKNPPKA